MKILTHLKIESEEYNEEHKGMDQVITFQGVVQYEEKYTVKGTWRSLFFSTTSTRLSTGTLRVKTQYWGRTAARIIRWVWWEGENVQSEELPFEVNLGSLFGETTFSDFTDKLIKEFC